MLVHNTGGNLCLCFFSLWTISTATLLTSKRNICVLKLTIYCVVTNFFPLCIVHLLLLAFYHTNFHIMVPSIYTSLTNKYKHRHGSDYLGHWQSAAAVYLLTRPRKTHGELLSVDVDVDVEMRVY